MPKFFIPKENIDNEILTVIGDDVSHITKVLRLRNGDTIECTDSAGYNYTAKIKLSEKDKVICEIVSKTKVDTEPPINVILIQGIPKAAKMDYIIQKNTELGIKEIFPCDLKRCVAKIDNSKKTERWQKISKEAAQQSGRGIIPKINNPINLDEAINIMKLCDISFVAYECEEQNSIKSVLKSKENPKSVAFIIGPEGGFDKSEIDKIVDAGIPSVSLGKRILRTETAGEAVLSMIMYEIGDINLI